MSFSNGCLTLKVLVGSPCLRVLFLLRFLSRASVTNPSETLQNWVTSFSGTARALAMLLLVTTNPSQHVQWLVATALRQLSIFSTSSVSEELTDLSSSDTDVKQSTLSWLRSLQSPRDATSACLREEDDWWRWRKSSKTLASLRACLRLCFMENLPQP